MNYKQLNSNDSFSAWLKLGKPSSKHFKEIVINLNLTYITVLIIKLGLCFKLDQKIKCTLVNNKCVDVTRSQLSQFSKVQYFYGVKDYPRNCLMQYL